MSRSKRKYPSGSLLPAGVMSSWKKDYHRKNRRVNKQLLNTSWDDEDLYINERLVEYSDVWDGPLDGRKHYFGYMKYPVTEYCIGFTYADANVVTEDNIDEFNLNDYEYGIVMDCIKRYGAYYDKELVVRRTYEEDVEEDNEMYKKLMRK